MSSAFVFTALETLLWEEIPLSQLGCGFGPVASLL